MNHWLDCINICCGGFLGIFDDLINFWDESIKNKMAAASLLKKIEVVGVGIIFFSNFIFDNFFYIAVGSPSLENVFGGSIFRRGVVRGEGLF